MSTQQDVAEARQAADALAAAVERLRASHQGTLDVRRLAEDVRRVRADLDLLADPAQPALTDPARPPGRGPEYDPREFVDGSYEGTTPGRP